MRRHFAIAVLALILAGCSDEATPPAPPPEPPAGTTTGTTAGTAADPETGETGEALRIEPVADDLRLPVHLAAAPGQSLLYVVEQEGCIVTLSPRRVFLDIRELVQAGGEQGLLSVAFHPGYERNDLFYVNYTDRSGDTRVVEYRGEPAKRVRELLHVEQPYPNHNGGQLAFGPDGLLYVGMGDGGAGGDPEGRAQDLSERLGKLLALDVDDPEADWQTVGLGLRNPWRFSFDRMTGDLWLADVGQGEREEVDFRPRAKLAKLANYGWDVYEGSQPFEDGELGPGDLVEPVAEYSHDDPGGGHCSVTGGFVHRGGLAGAEGRYFYGDYCSGTVWSLDAGGGRPRREPFKVPQLASFGEGPKGELYLVSQDGVVYRLQ